MDALARVTLLEPFAPNGKESPAILPYGFGEARVLTANGDIAPGIAGDEIVDAGAHLDLQPRVLARIIPGRPQRWELWYNLPGKKGEAATAQRSALVPLDAARLWFGDERIPVTSPNGTPVTRTFNWERDRVATQWGGWRKPQRALNGRNACTKGENDYDDTKIGAPRIPVVEVVRISMAGSPVGEPFRPWDHFKWEADVDLTHPELAAGAAAGAKAAASALAGFSIEDLEAFIAARKAATAGAA